MRIVSVLSTPTGFLVATASQIFTLENDEMKPLKFEYEGA